MAPQSPADGSATSADPLLERLRLATRGVYEVEGELGRGGMAVVYLGIDRRLERRVAIKVMDPRLSLTQGMAERFLREARIAARLQHPNIITVYEIRQSDDIIFFVMSLVDGVAVDEICRTIGPLPIDQARWILLQASRALAFAHSEGVVHRDIKPANILLNFKGEVVLTDFGIAKALGGEGLTQSGQSIGTPVYMSPEQFSGMELGPPSDQYSLGVTAYQLLTGKAPFGGDLYQLVAAHGTAAAAPLRDLRPDCPAFLANAVMRMLEKRPSERWPSLDDLQEVFGANMAMDGGIARRKLAETAVALRRERAGASRIVDVATPGAGTSSDTFIVTISPSGATIFVGGALELRASVSLDTGQSLPGAAVEWSSSDPAVITVSPTGALTGLQPGSALIRASVHRAWADASIRVEVAPIARLSLNKPNVTMRVGDVMLPEVMAVDVNGVTRPDTSLVWISRSPAVAELDAPGRIRAISPGLVVVDVSIGNVRRSIDVTVVRRPISSLRLHAVPPRLELGAAVSLRVDAFDDVGAAVVAPPVRWTSSAPSVVHVDSAGTALAIGPGVARIAASVDEATDSVELEALEPPVGAIQLSLGEAAVEVGDDVNVVLRVKDPNGALRSSNGVRVWSSTPELADYDAATSVIRTRAVGEVLINAAVDDPRHSAEQVSVRLVVRPVSVVRLDVFPEALDIEIGAVAALNVRGVDRRGREVKQFTSTWVCDAPEMAVVEGAGIVRALQPGATSLRVRTTNSVGLALEEVVPVRVRPASIARLSITAEHTMLSSGDIEVLRVSTWSATGIEVPDAVPLWRSTDPAVARVEGSGRLLALAPGRATIIAELDGKNAQITILVAPAPIVGLSMRPESVSAIVGASVPLRCEAVDRDGNGVKPQVRWTVSPADLARVNESGDLTALRAGSGRVRASLVTPADSIGVLTSPSQLYAEAALETRDARVVSLNFDVTSCALKVGERRKPGLNALGENGAAFPLTGVRLKSENVAIVKVLSNGNIEAVTAGATRVIANLHDEEATLSVNVTAVEKRAAPSLKLLLGGAVAVVLAIGAVFALKGNRTSSTGAIDTPSIAAVAARGAPDVASPRVTAPTPAVRDTAVAVTPIATPAATQTSTATSTVAPSARDSAAQPANRGRTTISPAQTTIVAPRDTARKPAPKKETKSPFGNVPDRPVAPPVNRAQPTTTVTAPVLPPVTRAPTTEPATTPAVAPPAQGAGAQVRPQTPVVDPAPAASADLPTRDELRVVAERIADEVRNGRRRTGADLTQFFADGADYSVSLSGLPTVVSEAGGRTRAEFELRLSRRNNFGVPERRVLGVTMEVSRRNQVPTLESVVLGALRKGK